jgi:tetratricopeptide (TPR) repeat protein
VNKKVKLILTGLVLALAMATPGCSIINKLRAKDNLNEGVREFNKGKFDIAEDRFKRALDLSADIPNAQLYYARAVNQRFEQGLQEADGERTILAYEKVIEANPDNHDAIDSALAFEADVYDKLSRAMPAKAEEFIQKRRELLLRRAELPGATKRTKADVYYTIGHSYWKECYYGHSERYTKYNQPVPPAEAEKMKPIVQRAHEYLQKAISTDPEYANAYFYEKLVYIEEAKTLDPVRARQMVDTKVKEMQDLYVKMNAQQKQKEAAEAASTSQ